MTGQSHPRMSDVAARAGVSLSTVSRALREAPGVAQEVRDRVRQAANDLSYVVSRDASALVTGATGRIAVLVPFLQPWFFGVALSGVANRLRAAERDMLTYEVGDRRAARDVLAELPLKRNVDAVIALALDLGDEEIAVLDEIGVPVVFASQCVQGRPSVFVDNAAATAAATRQLINLGHTRIGFVQPSDSTGFSWNSRTRAQGFQRAMAEAGLTVPDEAVVRTESGPRGGADAAAEFLARPDPPTAVVAESDDVAFGVLRTAWRSGVAVPGALSVTGFDNHDTAELLGLTTVEQPVSELGARAAELAVQATAEPDVATHVELPTRLVVRDSAARPRTTGRLVEAPEDEGKA